MSKQIPGKTHQLAIRTHRRAGSQWTLCQPGDWNCYVVEPKKKIPQGGPYSYEYCQSQVESARKNGMSYVCYNAS